MVQPWLIPVLTIYKKKFVAYATRFPRNRKASTNPAMNPPTCAMYATPPVSAVAAIEPMPLNNCRTNHNPITISAGIWVTPAPTMTVTLRCGNNKTYAPSTPAIAPDAPRFGILDPMLNAIWANVAATPQTR